MPKTSDTEYRSRAGVEDETEDRNERVDDRVDDKVDDRDKDKTEFSSDDRDSSFRAANQHIVKFTDELRGINEQAALNFDRRKNPAEFDMSEKKEMVEAVEKAFNQTGWNSAFERRTTAARWHSSCSIRRQPVRNATSEPEALQGIVASKSQRTRATEL